MCGVRRKTSRNGLSDRTLRVLAALAKEPMTGKELEVRLGIGQSVLYTTSLVRRIPGLRPQRWEPTEEGLERLRAETVLATEEVRGPQSGL